MTDRLEQLEQRVKELEHGQGRMERGVSNGQNTFSMFDLRQMGLTRRQAISAMVAIAGGAALPVALSEAVAAQPTGDEGQVGTQADPVEVWASEIDATEIATEQIGNARHYAGAYSGGDVDARLDAALSAASNGDVIYLEQGSYTAARTGSSTIDKSVVLVGHIAGSNNSNEDTLIGANWTFDTGNTSAELTQVVVNSGATVQFNGPDSRANDIQCIGTLSFNNDRCVVWGITSVGTVVFQSGTSDGEGGVIAGGVTTTDNGSNNFLT